MNYFHKRLAHCKEKILSKIWWIDPPSDFPFIKWSAVENIHVKIADEKKSCIIFGKEAILKRLKGDSTFDQSTFSFFKGNRKLQ